MAIYLVKPKFYYINNKHKKNNYFFNLLTSLIRRMYFMGSYKVGDIWLEIGGS